jgi:tRNA(fMet)-specific endonuclease VapC
VKRFLLDTGAAADYIFRRRGVYDRARKEVAQGNLIGVSVPVLGELFAGAEYSATRERNRRRLVQQLKDLTEWPFDRRAAEEFGRLFALLRQMGRPMQQIDIQTAAIVLVLPHCTLITGDSDFSAIPGLAVEAWL